MKYEQNHDGYIVFEDGGIDPFSYGAAEQWFPSYDEAVQYALETVAKRAEEFKDRIDCNSVIVYEGSKELLHKGHTCPCGTVVFEWRNYRRR